MADLPTNFWRHIRKQGTCWIWTAYVNPSGYGQTTVHSRLTTAHRAAYEALRGPIPADMVIDHLCSHRTCCNPDHMEIVTRGENTLRGNGPSAQNKRRQFCIHGHEFSPENTRIRPNGKRECRACESKRKASQVARYHARYPEKRRQREKRRWERMKQNPDALEKFRAHRREYMREYERRKREKGEL